MAEKVIVALSGGVDSAVTAALLQKEGYAVEGVFMKNWTPLNAQSLTDCPWEQDQADAEAVCKHLGIPFRSINFEKEYKEKVVDYLLREYNAGRTPNPDVMCNKEIKFAAFLDAAHASGVDTIATGHYAQWIDGELRRGVDPGKDQSYFLYALDADQLKNVMMPVGKYQKKEVRELAEEFGLPNSKKKDSQGICFIGHLNLKEFLIEELGTKPGPVYLLPSYEEGVSLQEREWQAKPVGEHLGVAFHTIGEKMGHYLDNRLYRNIRGETQVPSTFALSKDIPHNRVYITEKHDDPHFLTTTLQIEEVVATGKNKGTSIIDSIRDHSTLACQVRYQQKPVAVEELAFKEGVLHVALKEPVWAAAVGQSAVIYEEDRVVGGGVICATS
jgi:tRNA-specific 2-thiouridylase